MVTGGTGFVGSHFVNAAIANGHTITCFAGPMGWTKQKTVVLVYIGLKKGKKVQVFRCLFKGKKRSSIQKATVKKVFDLILSVAK